VEPNLILITSATLLGATGLALLFVGTLMAILVALGNKHFVYGVLIFVFFPVAFIYAIRYRDKSDYAGKLLGLGLILILGFIALLWWEMSRLGLDVFEMLSSAKPTHDMKPQGNIKP